MSNYSCSVIWVNLKQTGGGTFGIGIDRYFGVQEIHDQSIDLVLV